MVVTRTSGPCVGPAFVAPRSAARRPSTPLGLAVSLLVALAAVLFVSSPAHAASVTAVIGGVHYEADDGDVPAGATAVGFDSSLTGPLTIPASVTIGTQNYAVTHIGDVAFDGATSLGAVTIPDSVISIGENAFFQAGVTSLHLGNAVETIGGFAFAGNDLGAVSIPDSVASIGEMAFAQSGVTSLDLGTGVGTIGEKAFAGNDLGAVSIPDSVASIGEMAFAQSGVTSLNLGAGVVAIGDEAFASNDLGAVSIPDSVISIGASAFVSAGVTSLDLGHGVQTIGNYAFGMNEIDAIVIPDSVISIGVYAFSLLHATSLDLGQGVQTIDAAAFSFNEFTSLSIPASVTSIGDWAFAYVPLTSVMFWGTAPSIAGAGSAGSFGPDEPARPLGFLAVNGDPAIPGSFVTPMWEGYTTKSFGVSTPPLNVVGVPGDTQVDLSWVAPTDDGGSAITGYVVEFTTDGGATWITGPSAIGAAVTVTGLTNGVGYEFRVSALNEFGSSEPSEPSAQVVPQERGDLPATGSETGGIFVVGFGLLLVGAALMRTRRPRHA